MSHPKYKHIGSPAMRIIEECGEILQAIITHTPCGYDLGWYRLINRAEVIKIKR